jgi:hypothetical protein
LHDFFILGAACRRSALRTESQNDDALVRKKARKARGQNKECTCLAEPENKKLAVRTLAAKKKAEKQVNRDIT